MGIPAGRQSDPRTADSKVRDTRVHPLGSQATLRQRQRQSGWTKAWLQTQTAASLVTSIPSSSLFQALIPTNLRVPQRDLSPSATPHSHTHSPFLKISRSAGRCRPRNTTMSAADGLHLNLPRAPDNTFDTAQPQGDSGRRDAKQAHSQLPGTVRAGGGGAAPGSPPTFATDPAHPLTPPPSRIQGNRGPETGCFATECDWRY